MTKHPAKFSAAVLDAAAEYFTPGQLVLDPFAGIGRIASIPGIRPVAVEIERDWATQVVGSALHLPFADETFDAVFTSPTYGNRMADHHNAQDGSRRNTYRHTLGHKLHPDNSGQLQWGEAYRTFHEAAWREVWRVLGRGGFFLLNISDHIRKGVVIPVAEWHAFAIANIGFTYISRVNIETPRLRYGQNGEARVGYEHLYMFLKEF